MPVQNLHLRSSVQGRKPSAGTNAGQLPLGSIAINFNTDEPFLSIQDASGQVRRIAGIKIGNSQPSNPTNGEFWFDTSGADDVVKIYNNGWVAIGSSDGLKAGDNISLLNNDAGYLTDADIDGTDLTYTEAVDKGTVNSSNGTGADIPLAGAVNAGLFSAAEKTKLTGIEDGAEVNTINAGDNVSELNNDAGYLASGDNVSELNNDAGYLTDTTIPALDYLPLDGGNLTGAVTQTERTVTAGAFDLAEGNLWTAGAIAVPNPTNAVVAMSGLIRLTGEPTSWGGNFANAPTSVTVPSIVPFYVEQPAVIRLGAPVEVG